MATYPAQPVTPGVTANFDQNYQPINSSYPGNAPSNYVAGAHDTSLTIAQAVWGDSTLWYLIAEANGAMSANDEFVEGQPLIIPNKVTNLHNNAGTFKPYNPAEALGNVMPTALPPPPPPPKKKRNLFGAILMVVIAVVVTVATAGALGPVMGPVAAGAIGAATGSIASQAVGLATGTIDKFSWSNVATAAIGGGIGGAISGVGGVGGMAETPGYFGDVLKIADSPVLTAILRGTVTNAATQGVSMAVGLQKHFELGVCSLGSSHQRGQRGPQQQCQLQIPGRRRPYGLTFPWHGFRRSCRLGRRVGT
ncbi:MAG: hypothetical protein QM742_10015 [Aquabacterium sp.]